MEDRLIRVEDFMNEVIKYPHQSLKTIGEALDKTPTVDAVPIVHASWGLLEKIDSNTSSWYCSNCGHADEFCDDVNVPFCWHCGARMDKEEGEQNE